MAKKKAEPSVSVTRSAASVFAQQRRLDILPDAEGEQLKALLQKAGARFSIRRGADFEMIKLEELRFVIQK